MQRRRVASLLTGLGLLAGLSAATGSPHQAGATGVGSPVCRPAPAPKSSLIYALADHNKIYFSKGGAGGWKPVSAGLPSNVGVYAVGLDAVSSDVIYAGTTGEGIYKTFNGGAHWFSANDESIATTYVYAMAVNPKNNSHVYAGGDNAVYRSTDGGLTWEQGNIGLPSFLIYSIALDTANPDIVYVGTDSAGVYRSDAAFVNWTPVSDGLPLENAVRTLVTDPAHAGVIYAGTDSGLFKTANGGTSWQILGDLLAGHPVLAVALTPGNSRVIYAGTAQGLYRTADGGGHWSRIAGQLGNVPVAALAVDPGSPQYVYAAVRGAIWRTTNGGGSWTMVSTGLPASTISALAVFHATITPAWPCLPPSGTGNWQFFPTTGHSVAGPFLAFYTKNGGQATFGVPRTEAIAENGVTVQYFENAELQLVGGKVQIVTIGDLYTKGRIFTKSAPNSGTKQHPLFRLGDHNVSDIFLRFWRLHGGAAVLGMPISEEIHEQNDDGTGTLYQVQFFEKARLEYHPELHGSAVVQLGKLGDALLRRRGWI